MIDAPEIPDARPLYHLNAEHRPRLVRVPGKDMRAMLQSCIQRMQADLEKARKNAEVAADPAFGRHPLEINARVQDAERLESSIHSYRWVEHFVDEKDEYTLSFGEISDLTRFPWILPDEPGSLRRMGRCC